MTDAPIPHFPVVHGNVYPDGTAHINFAGHDVPLTPASIADARAQITSYAVAVARDVLHRPVRLTTVDPDGHWILAAYPDGRVTDLAPAARPAKRPRWRRAAVDQDSANGTTIDRRGVEVIAAPGVAMPLQAGGRLRFGGLTCQVTVTVESELPDE
jgi:hypothetical protein